jgi:hypothetical protein
VTAYLAATLAEIARPLSIVKPCPRPTSNV